MDTGFSVCIYIWTFWLFFFLFVLTIGFIMNEIRGRYHEVVFLQKLIISILVSNYREFEHLKNVQWK